LGDDWKALTTVVVRLVEGRMTEIDPRPLARAGDLRKSVGSSVVEI
jgi:hypothetical protein